MPKTPNAPKLPKPFSRPSVDLDRHTKVWRDIYPEDLDDGDLVVDCGTVEEVIPGENYVRVLFINGRVKDFGLNDQIRAFTRPGE